MEQEGGMIYHEKDCISCRHCEPRRKSRRGDRRKPGSVCMVEGVAVGPCGRLVMIDGEYWMIPPCFDFGKREPLDWEPREVDG